MNDATLLDTSRAPPRAGAANVTVPEASVVSSGAPSGAPPPTRTTVLPRVTLEGAVPQLVSEERVRFETAQELGRGGVGEVVLARDNDINRPVAIKRLLPDFDDPAVVARFVEEIRTLGALDHPNIVPVHDVGVGEDGRYYYVMKFVEGETLEHILDRLAAGDAEYHRRYPFARRTEIFRQILHGVQYAHERGVIHRDLKPANVMVGRYGEVVVMDWGLARRVSGVEVAAAFPVSDKAATLSRTPGRAGRLRTVSGSLLGTPAYMSPEQARGDNERLDARSDIYSLCVMFHEMLTLRHYLADRQSIAECVAGVLRDDPPFAHFVRNPHQPAPPPDLSHFVRHGIAKDPAKRYGSVAEMLERLDRIEDGRCPVECPSTFTKRASTEVARLIDHRPITMMVAGGTVVCVALVGVVTLVLAALRA